MDCNNGVPSQVSTLSRAEKALVKRNVSRPSLANNAYYTYKIKKNYTANNFFTF